MSRYTLYNKSISRLMAVLLALVLVLSMVPSASATEAEGTCGESLSWAFSDGVLTITGTGAMYDYDQYNYAPWYSFREQILRIALPEGLTRVGNMAFYDCVNLQAASIPSTVTEIGELAFCQCQSMTILTLNEGLVSIGRSAFELCSAVQDIRLPQSLTSIGRRAFYRCAGLLYVTVPASVANMGSAVFAYCESLLRAEVKAPLSSLPRWTFYGCESLTSISLAAETTGVETNAVNGCENLNVVYYGGTEMNAETLKEQISGEKEDFANYGQVSGEESGNSESGVSVETNTDGDVIVENTTVTKTEESTVSVSTSTNATNGGVPSDETRVEATVVTPEGWNQVLESIENATENGPVDVTVYVSTGIETPQSVLDALAGKNVTMNVQSGDGSRFGLDFSIVDGDTVEEKLDLSYTLTRLESPEYKGITAERAYGLRFTSSSTVHAEVHIQLPIENARKTATLYQVEGEGVSRLQSVVADDTAAAHFYLASVDSETEYFIGIDVPEIPQEEVIIPAALEKEYGITEQIQGVDYVITGRTSSWGMSIGQVSWILAGVMVVCVVGVGVFMFALNKRKLRQGYVPDLGEDEEEI